MVCWGFCSQSKERQAKSGKECKHHAWHAKTLFSRDVILILMIDCTLMYVSNGFVIHCRVTTPSIVDAFLSLVMMLSMSSAIPSDVSTRSLNIHSNALSCHPVQDHDAVDE